MIKHRYAKGTNGIININELSDSTRWDYGPYICYGCGNELIPKLGTIRAKYFSHKANINCSPETYLHQVAKEQFTLTYQKCLFTNTPFIMRIEQTKQCNQFQELFAKEPCKKVISNSVDLTKHFEQINIEKYLDNFTPDILLSSSKHNEIFFVEIAVTHKCDENKINSGFRILEFQISTEEDLAVLMDNTIDTGNPLIKTYNFKEQRTANLCNQNCSRELAIFIVYKSKKSILTIATPSKAQILISNDQIVYYEVDIHMRTGVQRYKDKIRKTHLKNNIPISSCYLCRYHGGPSDGMAVFCKFLKKSVPAHEALKCEFYRTYTTEDEYIKADDDNRRFSQSSLYKKNHGIISLEDIDFNEIRLEAAINSKVELSKNDKFHIKPTVKKVPPTICTQCKHHKKSTNSCSITGLYFEDDGIDTCSHFE